jgi:hypothetical protein
MNPFAALLKSRKFWLGVMDVVVSVTLFFVTKVNAAMVEDVKFLIGALQPMFIMIIGSIAYEDGEAMKAGVVKE